MTRQKVPLVRREYNRWVANETLEDYALRYTATRARRWSSASVANTALGIVSFLALEAIGGAITLGYGFTNALWAICVVTGIIFLSALPISFYAAKYGVDIDLLTRGAGFGYMGSTISSLIYASFTFIFFALEAAIMSMAIHMATDMPLSLAYFLSAVLVIPLVTHGISRISRFQAITQPVWIVLQIAPIVFILYQESNAIGQWINFDGVKGSLGGGDFTLVGFGAAAAIIFPLIAQNGEQADFLRFLPKPKGSKEKRQWWTALLFAGPGWAIIGALKLLLGSFLAFLALQKGIEIDKADDPAHMYAVAFQYLTNNAEVAVWIAAFFVVVSQLKINVTNAYAGSIAWGNFFSRLTHNHPGRVVWLVFNVAIALLLMELGLYQAFEEILVTYATLVVAWVGTLVADLVINKPLGLSPKQIEFRRGHLYDINPVGVVSMVIASVIGIMANLSFFGEATKALAAFLALGIPFITAPFLAWVTAGKYYLCRPDQEHLQVKQISTCSICSNDFEPEDMSHCPSYGDLICSLCCSLDARCGDQCRENAHMSAQLNNLFYRFFPKTVRLNRYAVTISFLIFFTITSLIIAGLLGLVFYANINSLNTGSDTVIASALWQVFFLLVLVAGVLVWLYVLAQRSAGMALKETQNQTTLLEREVDAHKTTAEALRMAKNSADAANIAKNRYLSGVSHELRTPLNTIFGYAQLLEEKNKQDAENKNVAAIIKRSCEHLSGVIEGLLEISKIEARKLDIQKTRVSLSSLIDQLEDMFSPMATAKNIGFKVVVDTELPLAVSADEKRLKQILLNLLSNAIKFTHKGEVRLSISFRNQVGHFKISDTGIGISKEDQEKIFEPFFRSKAIADSTITGSGLGLSISRLLAEMMGGSIEVVSDPNLGSEFSFHLFMPVLAEQMAGSKIEKAISGYEGDRIKLLVVDDNKDHRALIQALLSPLGFNVDTAANQASALALLKQNVYQLLMLDIQMPGASGWNLLGEIRDLGITAPVLMVSANPEDSDGQFQQGVDYDAFVVKPVRFENLINQLRMSLQIQWVYSSKKPESTEPNVGDDLEQIWELLAEMKSHAQIGYLSGVKDALSGIATVSAQADCYMTLKNLVDRCDLAGIVSEIDKLEANR